MASFSGGKFSRSSGKLDAAERPDAADFGGTDDNDDDSSGSGDGSGVGSGPIDAGAIFGAGGGSSGDDTGSGDGSGSGDADEFVRNADGSIKRNKDGSPRKRRGRKPGVSNRPGAPSKAKLSVEGVTALLLSIHTMGAAALKTPELALTEGEAQSMASAVANVARHYPTQIDPRVLDWSNLIMCLGMAYGPRLYNIRERQEQERRQRRASVPQGATGVQTPTPQAANNGEPPPPGIPQVVLDFNTIRPASNN